MKRVLFDLVLFIGLFIFPWWAVFLLAVIGAFWKRHFYELACIGFLYDLLYALPGEKMLGVPYFLTWLALVLFIAIEFFARERLRIYTD